MKIFLLIICAMFFVSCNNRIRVDLENNIAEVREFVLAGKSNGVTATLMCGSRESEYILNGVATPLVEFGVITFDLDNIDDFDVSNASYVLNVGSLRFAGLLEKNPFDNTLVADIKKVIDCNANISAKIIIGDFSRLIELDLVNKEWKINSSNIIEILTEDHRDKLRNFIINKKFAAEVYIKIINDSDIYKDNYYWYVNILGREGSSYNLVISPHTGQTLASNYKKAGN